MSGGDYFPVRLDMPEGFCTKYVKLQHLPEPSEHTDLACFEKQFLMCPERFQALDREFTDRPQLRRFLSPDGNIEVEQTHRDCNNYNVHAPFKINGEEYEIFSPLGSVSDGVYDARNECLCEISMVWEGDVNGDGRKDLIIRTGYSSNHPEEYFGGYYDYEDTVCRLNACEIYNSRDWGRGNIYVLLNLPKGSNPAETGMIYTPNTDVHQCSQEVTEPSCTEVPDYTDAGACSAAGDSIRSGGKMVLFGGLSGLLYFLFK